MFAAVEQEAIRRDEESTGELEFSPAQQSQADRVRRILQRSIGVWTFPREYWDLMQRPGYAVHAPRQTGKTEALLNVIDTCRDPAIVVCPNREMAHDLRTRYWTEFKVKDIHTFANASSAQDFLRGNNKPVFCDEWFMFDYDIQEFLARSGRIKAAIGTIPGRDDPKNPTIEIVPLI